MRTGHSVISPDAAAYDVDAWFHWTRGILDQLPPAATDGIISAQVWRQLTSIIS
jgi:hypothetical protein